MIDLYFSNGSGHFFGRLSQARHDTEERAQEYETRLYDLAKTLLGRNPTFTEVHRRQALMSDRPYVDRQDYPPEVRWASLSTARVTTDTQSTLSEADRLRLTLDDARERMATSGMSQRERMNHGLIKSMESRLRAIEDQERRDAELADILASDGYHRRTEALHKYEILAGFSRDFPRYEPEITTPAMRKALEGGDLPKFDSFEIPFLARVMSRRDAAQEQLQSASRGPLASIDALDSILGADDAD